MSAPIPFFLVAFANLVPLGGGQPPALAGAVGFTKAEPFAGGSGLADYVVTVSPEMVGAMGSPDFLVTLNAIGDGSLNIAARAVISPFPPSAPQTSLRVQLIDPSTGAVYPEPVLVPFGAPIVAMMIAIQRKGPASIDGA